MRCSLVVLWEAQPVMGLPVIIANMTLGKPSIKNMVGKWCILHGAVWAATPDNVEAYDITHLWGMMILIPTQCMGMV